MIIAINQMQAFIEQLDYDITDFEERKQILHNTIHITNEKTGKQELHPFLFEAFYERYNPNITQTGLLTDSITFFQKLESLASYILYGKQKDDYIVKPQTQQSRDKKNTLFSHLEEVPGRTDETLHKAKTQITYKVPQKTITLHDIEIVPGIKPIYNWIQALKNKVQQLKDDPKNPHTVLIRKLNMNMNEAKTDMHILKDSYLRPMSFCRLSYHTTEYDFDVNTQYIDHGRIHFVSHNSINLSDPHHIHQLLNHYSALRHQHHEDTQSDMKYILDSLDDLIQRTSFQEVFRRVIIRRIDGASFQDISDELLEDFNLSLSVAYLSSTFASHIPKKIAETHRAIYEDWYYLNIEKGNYKKCSGPCGQIKLRTEHNFRKDGKAKDGLCNVCKECRKRE